MSAMFTLIAAAVLAQAAPQTSQIEAAITAELKDPDSAKFTWPHGFIQGAWKNLYGRTFSGSITCGTINAKNGYGGYSGPEAVVGIVGMDGGVMFETDDSYQDTVNHGYVANRCRDMGLPVL